MFPDIFSTNLKLSCLQFASSFSGEGALPPNLLLPTNLVDPSRLSESEPLVPITVLGANVCLKDKVSGCCAGH